VWIFLQGFVICFVSLVNLVGPNIILRGQIHVRIARSAIPRGAFARFGLAVLGKLQAVCNRYDYDRAKRNSEIIDVILILDEKGSEKLQKRRVKTFDDNHINLAVNFRAKSQGRALSQAK